MMPLNASAQSSPAPAPDPLKFESAEGFAKFGVMSGIQVITQYRSFWELARTYAPAAGFNPTMTWGEAFLKPSVIIERRIGESLTVYGGASAMVSKTMGRDVFDVSDGGRIGLEEGYAGLRFGDANAPVRLDLSAGAQTYRIGSGMLIADGGADGFERGALIFGPRQAWSMTVLARASVGLLKVEGFYLDPNELASSETATRIAGAKAEWTLQSNQFAGLAYGKVLHSTAPYPQAATGGNGTPAIRLAARDGLQFVHGYFRIAPLPEAASGLWIAGDLAVQTSERIDLRAWGGRAEIGYVFAELPWRPTLSYAYQTFSGDDPNTARLERFDPLYYEGSPAGWATGSNGSFVFINSNVNAHRLAATFTVTAQDLITVRYAHVRANELNSPVQFGQATRFTLDNGVPALLTGVRSAHLSDDVLVEYTRILSPHAFLTLGGAWSRPGAGITELMAPFRSLDWFGGFANLVVRY